MKKIITAVVLVAMTLATFTSAEAERRSPRKSRAISSVCTSIVTLPNSGFIYKQSAPLRSGGVGTPLIGYRKEPTLISNQRNGANRGGANIYASNGTKIGSCPWTTAEGHSGGRYRCTMQTSSLRRSAIKASGSPSVFFSGRTAKSCIKVPDAGRCYGSVKGLCNQLIK